MDFSSNQLTGSVPDSFSGGNWMRTLILTDNQLTSISGVILWSTFLSLNVAGNLLSGTVPTAVPPLSFTQYSLNFSNNLFTGEVPLASLLDISYQQTVDISSNCMDTDKVRSRVIRCELSCVFVVVARFAT
jgi:hypothetical protein